MKSFSGSREGGGPTAPTCPLNELAAGASSGLGLMRAILTPATSVFSRTCSSKCRHGFKSQNHRSGISGSLDELSSLDLNIRHKQPPFLFVFFLSLHDEV